MTRLSGQIQPLRFARVWAAEQTEAGVIFVALLCAAAVRCYYTLQADFPLNDGGMFMVMMRELGDNGFRLPATTAYNGLDLPFAYPPLGFYVGAAVTRLTGLSELDVLRFVPLVANLAAVAAFYPLARVALPDRKTAAIALFAFALLPESFAWQIMGGGLTRSFGLLFAILAIRFILPLYRDRRLWLALPATVFSALTLLSHLEAGYFVALTAAIFAVAYCRSARQIAVSVAIAGGVLLLTAPWWATVLHYHGLAPLQAALGTNDNVLDPLMLVRLLEFNITSEPMFPLIGGLALLGSMWELLHGRRLLPCWMVAIWVFDARGGHNYVTLPLALLAASGFAGVIVPAWQRLRPSPDPVPLGLGGLVVAYAILAGMLGATNGLAPLSAEQRQAMAWVQQDTPPDSRFVVITGYGFDIMRGRGKGLDRESGWGWDRTAEWFPALTGRRSVNTPQGREWQPNFLEAQRDYYRAQRCAVRDLPCLDAYADSAGVAFDYVYVPKEPEPAAVLGEAGEGCCWALRTALRASSDYRTVYDSAGASIFQRIALP